jgi:hypothetical protein
VDGWGSENETVRQGLKKKKNSGGKEKRKLFTLAVRKAIAL